MKLILLSIFLGLTFAKNHLNHSIDPTKLMIRTRLLHLKKFSSSNRLPCPKKRHLVISRGPYGRTSNNLIEFTHAIWLSKILNATFSPPQWMKDLLNPFSSSTGTALESNYCLNLNSEVPEESTVFTINSEQAFFLFEIWENKTYWTNLEVEVPPLKDSILDISHTFLQVYSILWSSPLKRIQIAAEWIIANYLDNNLRYTSIHKRQLEGGCNAVLLDVTKPSDFSPLDLPMYRPEWLSNSSHPLCEMPLDFILETLYMHKRDKNSTRIFISFDGNGDRETYTNYGVVFGDVLQNAELGFKLSSDDMKYVDMFVAMHGDFFILNPRSTFSWEIYIIRVVLGLQSVPLVTGNDFYLRKMPTDLWVSWTSTISAISGIEITY
jgi:hypothetical protein